MALVCQPRNPQDYIVADIEESLRRSQEGRLVIQHRHGQIEISIDDLDWMAQLTEVQMADLAARVATLIEDPDALYAATDTGDFVDRYAVSPRHRTVHIR